MWTEQESWLVHERLLTVTLWVMTVWRASDEICNKEPTLLTSASLKIRATSNDSLWSKNTKWGISSKSTYIFYILYARGHTPLEQLVLSVLLRNPLVDVLQGESNHVSYPLSCHPPISMNDLSNPYPLSYTHTSYELKHMLPSCRIEERMAQTFEIWSACRPMVSKHWTKSWKSCLSCFPFNSQAPP